MTWIYAFMQPVNWPKIGHAMKRICFATIKTPNAEAIGNYRDGQSF